MTQPGWSNYGDSSNYQLDNEFVYEGSTCLRVDNPRVDGGLINDQTATDTPQDVAHECYVYIESTTGPGPQMLFQVDANAPLDTHTRLTTGESNSTGDITAIMERVENGAVVESDSVLMGSGAENSWSGVILSDGDNAGDRWWPCRIECFWDSNTDLRARVREDADGDGTWTDLTQHDLVLSSVSGPQGGAVGVGGVSHNDINSGDMRIDASEIYY